MEWYEKIGYDENPFETNPLKTDFGIMKNNEIIDELEYRINAGNIVLIIGSEGSGKTTILKSLIKRVKGKKIYHNGKNISKNLNIEKLINKKSLFRRKPLETILLLDNIQTITSKNAEIIKNYYDQNKLKAVIFTASKKPNLPKSIYDRIGKRMIELKKPTEKDAVKVTADRLNNKDLLSEKLVKKIFNISKQNLNQHLYNCEIILKHLVKNKKKEITDKELIKLLTKKHYEEPDKSKTCYQCGKPLQKIKDKWRCPNCESYCLKCGSIVEEKDTKCPNCKAKFEVEK